MKAIVLALGFVAGTALCLLPACDLNECNHGASRRGRFYCDIPGGTQVSGAFSLELEDGTTWSNKLEDGDTGADAGFAGRRSYVGIWGTSNAADWDLHVRTVADSELRAVIRFTPPTFYPTATGDYPATLLSCPKGDMLLSTNSDDQNTCVPQSGSSVSVISRAITIHIDSIDATAIHYRIDDDDIHLVNVHTKTSGCYEHVDC